VWGACWLRTMEGENQEMQRAKGGRDAESKVKGGATTGFYVYKCYFIRLEKTSYLYLLFLKCWSG